MEDSPAAVMEGSPAADMAADPVADTEDPLWLCPRVMETAAGHTAVDPALDIAVTADTEDSPAAVTEDFPVAGPTVDPAADTAVDPAVDTAVDPAVDTAVDPAVDTAADPAATAVVSARPGPSITEARADIVGKADVVRSLLISSRAIILPIVR